MHLKSIRITQALIIITLLMSFSAFAQAPNLLNYQGVARNSVGNPLPNQTMKLRLSIHDLLPSGAVVYSEIRQITTNLGGLFSVQIGSAGASSSTGTLGGVNWIVGNKFLQVELDPASNNNYLDIGTVQLVSVPYAFGAGSAATVKTNANLTGVVTSVGNATSIANGAITSDMIGTLNKSKVGLDLVNNTTDASKPISTATQAALDLKANAAEVKTALDTKANASDVKTALDTKVDKVAGKDLSTNDYTTDEKTKLAAITGTNTGDQINITGNAATATKLVTTKNINGVPFDGSTDITIPIIADAGALTGTTLKSTVTASSLTSVGTISSGTISLTTNIKTSGTITAGAVTYPNIHGTSGQVLSTTGSGTLTWTTASGGGSGVSSIGAISGTSNVNGATISGTTLTLTPANETNGGILTTGTQTIAGAKTFSNTVTFNPDITVNAITIGRGGGNNDNNTSLGIFGLYRNTTGINNTTLGAYASELNTSGSYNTVIGTHALSYNTIGSFNTAIGVTSLGYNTGQQNTAVGQGSLERNTSGNYNTGIGRIALFMNTTGINNTALGLTALSVNETGSNNTAIGAEANVASERLNNTTAIGYQATVSTDNTIQLGNTSVTNVNTSGTLTAGAVTYPRTHGTSGQVLSTTGSGTLTWTTVSGGSGVPYTGAIGAVNLGAYDLKVQGLTIGLGNGSESSNTVFGRTALFNNANTAPSGGTAGVDNTAMGKEALYFNTTGSKNTSVGSNALYKNDIGEENTALGRLSLYNNTQGSFNTAIGMNALVNNTTGTYNTALGVWAGVDVNYGSLTNATAIGYSAKVTESNSIQLGNTSVTKVNTSGTLTAAGLGLGVNSPNASALLEVSSTSKGLLPPRMTYAQRNAITNPAQGLILYCTNCGANGEVEVYNGISWVNINGSAAAGILPVLTTSSLSSITSNSATSGGNISSDGGAAITARGVVWSTSSNPTIALSTLTTNGTGSGSFTSNISSLTASTTYYVRAYATNSTGTSYGNEISFATSVVSTPEVTTATGKTWMDRNLGASRVATSSNDVQAYGDLYQWGRGADGHQLRGSSTTSSLSSTDQPGNALFILNGGDWRTSTNDNLWQGVNGTNNPCPSGFRIPTDAEWINESATWSGINEAFSSPLKVTLAGDRRSSDGVIVVEGVWASFWTSTISGTNAFRVYFGSSKGTSNAFNRAWGFTVRCIKN